MAVVCSSLMSCFPGLLLRYFLVDSEMVPVAHAITAVAFGLTFHEHHICNAFFLYFNIVLTFSCSYYCYNNNNNNNINNYYYYYYCIVRSF
jgi:hypothetical protein